MPAISNSTASLVENFTATLAGRYEQFSDFGNTLNGKLALRYEFVPGFAVRGSISNGFRAPSLHQQFFTTTSTNFISGVPVDISTVPVDSPVAAPWASSRLEPEKSVNLSIGATANPFRGLNITADYYQIKIKDRIVLTENLRHPGIRALTGRPQRNCHRAMPDRRRLPRASAPRDSSSTASTRPRGASTSSRPTAGGRQIWAAGC